MSYIFVGLGNPGEEYKDTRHNVGRMALEYLAQKENFLDWQADKSIKALHTKGTIAGEKVGLFLPETFMNKSGRAVKPLVLGTTGKPSPKKLEKLVVVYDDVDLPFGKLRLSYGRSSGGHRGLESIIKALGSKDFLRIRIGITPTTPSGKIKKPSGEQAVLDFLLGRFSKKELEALEPVFQKVHAALEMFIAEGKDKAMNIFNSQSV